MKLHYIYFRGELLSLSMIENVHKKRAHDKESRLSTVMVGTTFTPDLYL